MSERPLIERMAEALRGLMDSHWLSDDSHEKAMTMARELLSEYDANAGAASSQSGHQAEGGTDAIMEVTNEWHEFDELLISAALDECRKVYPDTGGNGFVGGWFACIEWLELRLRGPKI